VRGWNKEVKMKLGQRVILIIMLLAIMPLSACEYLSGESQQKAYEEQLKAYQEYNQKLREYQEQQAEYQREVAEAYQKQLTEAYKVYSEGLNQYYEDRQKSIEKAIAESENQTQ
jgi:uncharacterized protein HemX